MRSARTPHPRMRLGAIAAIGALLVSGLAAVSPPLAPAASAAGPLPAGAELFRVSQTDIGASTQPYLTPDGQRVFFTSSAADLVQDDPNGVSDVFVSVATQGSDDPFSGAPTLVSVPDDALAATAANGDSSQPVASADGRYVAFTSAATNLVSAGGTADRTSIYVRDTVLGRTFRVQGAGEPNGSSYEPDISDSGTQLVFTSEATDLSAGDTNGAPDAFLADLDANDDGVVGDIAITRFLGASAMPGGTEQARISGDGSAVVFTAHSDAIPPVAGTTGDFVYRAATTSVDTFASLVGRGAHDPTIDATGDTFAFVDDDECDGMPAIIAGTLDQNFYYAAAGTILTDRRVGYIADPEISADGSRVTWTTTVPEYDFGAPAAELDAPVVRTQEIGWSDSRPTVDCFGLIPDWSDVAEGSEASVSASARTVAFSAPAPAGSTVFAIDTHRHEGLAVSSTQGQLVTPGYMSSIEIVGIPLTSLRGYSSTIANAPIYQLPIYQLPIYQLPIYQLPIYQLLVSDSPIYQLPIYQLPIYQLPIYQLEFPGGWPQVLADTPFEGELLQSVGLAEVLKWAEQTLATGSTATEAERAAADRIQSLTLRDVDVDSSALSALTLASYLLGNAPLGQIPLPGDGTPVERWQALVDAQGLGFQVDPGWLLSDLDAAGLDIARSGVDAVPLRSLPVPLTSMTHLALSSLFLAGTPLGGTDASSFDTSARIAMFGKADVTGPISSLQLLSSATVADLAVGAPPSVTVGILLMSMINRESYPWEQISAASIDPNLMEASTDLKGCEGSVRCEQVAQFQYAFDPGPGEQTRFAAPTAALSTPVGTSPYLTYVTGSGPDSALLATSPARQVTAERTRVPLPETPGGTVISIRSYYTATTQPGDTRAAGELSSGSITASDELSGGASLRSFDNPSHNLVNGVWESNPFPLSSAEVYYEWISPQWRGTDDEGNQTHGPAQDEDYYLVDPPPSGKRLVVSTNASDGQLSLSLYSPESADGPLGIAEAGAAPGTPVVEQNGPAGQQAQSGQDAGVPIQDQTLVDQTSVGGDGVAQVEAVPADATAGSPMLVRVTSGNRQPSSSLYSLRVQYIDEAPEVQCTPWTPPQTDDPGSLGVSDPVSAVTNTVFLFDEQRYGDAYGAAEAARVREALVSLTGDGHVGTDRVDGAVLAIDTSPAVRAARAALDGNPCSMAARERLSSAINDFVAEELGDDRSHISSVVIVGGDDIIPLAPVAQNTSQFTETSHADDLRLPKVSDTEPCPTSVIVDPCETPLSAAARTSRILTDDPYGLATSYETLGGHLYMPTAALGRLVETPDQIISTIQRFLDVDGVLTADSTLTGGYGAWSELPGQVTEALAWRSAVNQQLTTPWTATDLESRLFPQGADTPKVVSVNTHANETEMLPGVPGAESGRFSTQDLFVASDHEDASSLAGSLIFGIGCHAGNNLPTAYYGPVTDWVDVFSQAGGYIGNTGYGLANNVTTALGERLLGLYSQWLGVSVDGEQVSSGAALTYAKQSYLGGLGLYSGYDEKALMEAVYYGLPMYSLAEPSKTQMPLPEAPDLTPETSGGITTAGLSFEPRFDEQTAPDGGEYYTVDGSALAVPTAQGILPSIVRRLEPQPGLVPRGAILTALTTESQTGTPALSAPTIGVSETSETGSGSAFPSSFATITHQQTPAGPVDLLVVTPARVQVTQAGQGTTELFTKFTAEVVYGPDTSTDTTPPVIDSVTLPGAGSSDIEIRATDAGGPIAAVIVLVQAEGSDQWERRDAAEVVVKNADGTVSERYWKATPPVGSFRWMAQVIDAGGNVTVDSSQGHLDVAGAVAPTLGDPGPAVTIPLGERLQRAVQITDGIPGERLVASTTVTDAAGSPISSAPATVQTGRDNSMRALIDQPVVSPGASTVTLSVCRGAACATASFAVDTPPLNEAPIANVTLTSDTDPVQPSSILTAHATATDPEGQAVTAAYSWMRNGISIAGQSTSTLDLADMAQPGDIIRVTVVPSDGTTPGHAASDEVVVGREVVLPSVPTITATSTTSQGAYAEGAWSTSPVTVAFVCTAGAPLFSACPAPQTVTADTGAAGTVVTGSITDLLGRVATTSVLVRVDATAPELSPVVTPQTVQVGGTATATPKATDAGSGVASESCDVPQTGTAGAASVTCRATDVAGNTATALGYYTVEAPVPGVPVLTITATNAGGSYGEGAWSRTPVTVTFSCASGAAVTTCPEPRVVSADTTGAGLRVTGTMRDALDRSATGQILVRVDGTPPALAPVVTPQQVEVGATATAASHATDAASGVVAESCDPPDTSAKGEASVECRATDAAGNTAVAEARYTVVAKGTPTPTPTPDPTPTPTPSHAPSPAPIPTQPGSPATKPAPQPPEASAPSARPPRTGTDGGSTGAPAPLLPGVALPDRQALGPVAADGSSVYSHGSAVPVIFRALDENGDAIGTEDYVTGVVLVSSQDLPAAAAASGANEAYFLPFPFVYAKAADVWLGTIPTADLEAGKKYTYRVDLADGTSFTLTFGVSG